MYSISIDTEYEEENTTIIQCILMHNHVYVHG